MLDERAAGPGADASTPLASGNLAIKFALELAALALFAYWGATTGDGPWAVVLAIAAPAAMIAVWGRWAAPRSPHRLSIPTRVPVELGVFALAGAAGYAAGASVAATAFVVVAIVNALGLTVLRQWEQ
jgi:hypothetical protein